MPDAGDLLGQMASLDPEIRNRVKHLANLAMDEAEYIIKHGDPRSKQAIVRTFISSFAQHMKVETVNEEIEAMKGAMAKLREEVMGRVPGVLVDEAIELDGVVDVDRPR